ncbi:MAG TPA: radical SAM protein [Candidatus Syntrophoarchaeum butanivorans]|uniref:Radical SAM protein n=1 Tax=Candidatus Syntropharchaeum butanivorans TaxID=1839936 RepID=A0A7C1B3U8_9EURY|nr:radical SAM protein [Candidatus Syntrophoarchaeum butanivorans]
MAMKEFEIGPIRPPSEGGSFSLLIRATRNCPWSRCTFCYGTPYNREKFSIRPVDEIKEDIDIVKKISDDIRRTSEELGYGGVVNETVGAEMIKKNPELNYSQSFVNVFNWLLSGGRTVFIQDADSLIMKTRDLAEVIRYLKKTFPDIERITSYARSRTVAKKSLEEIKELKEAGLSRLHIGLESGDEEVLKYVKKGATPEDHIDAGRKVMDAGIELSEYVMPGLGGKDLSEKHARNTARVLNEIDPHFIRSRPLVPRHGTPLFEEYEKGNFKLLSPHELLREIRMLMEDLEVNSRICFDHMMNPSYVSGGWIVPLFDQDYEGYKLPDEKEHLLEIIEQGLKIKESRYISSKDLISRPHL